MHDQLRQIQIRLRLSMNGVVSTSMREKGLHYKLNFGVSIPQLKSIARDFPSATTLANLLWQQNVREMKILATLLQPVDLCAQNQVGQWIAEAPTREIIEQVVMNLAQHLPFAYDLAAVWIGREEENFQVAGCLLHARLFMQQVRIDPAEEAEFLQQVCRLLIEGSVALQATALLALKQFGRQSARHSERALACISNLATANSSEKVALYEELKFEFDYYK